MPKPPASPPSSDLSGVNRDSGKVVREGKRSEPHPQNELQRAADETAARPDYDPEIASKGNAQ